LHERFREQESEMKLKYIAVSALSAVLIFGAACTSNRSTTAHNEAGAAMLDDKPIKDSLKAANLDDVKVKVDNDNKVITLSGDVRDPESKERAAEIARAHSTGYAVANEIGVRPPGEPNAKKIDANMDDAIKSEWKAIEAKNNWGNQHVRTEVTNGVLKLKGDVDTPAQREQMEPAAAKIPGVQQVVNELSVKNAAR